MLWLVIGAVLVGLLITGWVARRVLAAAQMRRYGAFVDPPHMMEMAGVLKWLQQAAVTHVLPENDAVDPDRSCGAVTSLGLQMVYTVNRKRADYLHRVSVAGHASPIPPNLAHALLVHCVVVLGFDPKRVELSRTADGIVLCETTLNEAEHQESVRRGPRFPVDPAQQTTGAKATT